MNNIMKLAVKGHVNISHHKHDKRWFLYYEQQHKYAYPIPRKLSVTTSKTTDHPYINNTFSTTKAAHSLEHYRICIQHVFRTFLSKYTQLLPGNLMVPTCEYIEHTWKIRTTIVNSIMRYHGYTIQIYAKS